MIATRLDVLRSQLTGLRQARASARQLSAWSAVGTAVLWSLIGVFVLDWLFQRQIQVPQRVILLLIAAGVVAWAFRRYAVPLLKVHESDVDMALMVERQQQIDTDLVAAIQFEHDVDGRWGSRQLETAVIEYVAQLGKDIDVYQGFNREQLNRRATILGVTAALVLVAALIFPGYFGAFLNRVALGNAHYPSATQITHVAVNGHNVLTHGMRPDDIRCAEGRPIEFIIRCEQTLPADGLVKLASTTSSQRSEVELKPLTLEERLARLRTAKKLVAEARVSPGMDLAGPWLEELSSLVRYEAPQVWDSLKLEEEGTRASELGAQVQERLPQIEAAIGEVADAWPGDAAKHALFRGELPRLTDPVKYRLSLGDAYSDSSLITMIPLPAVEAKLTPVPPKYAAKALAAEQGGRQASVLVGSEVKVAVESTNKKPLREAWMIVRTSGSDETSRYDLKANDTKHLVWTLDSPNTKLKSVTEEIRYEIQVTDEDGLHLETPIKGSVRIRLDKAPVAIVSTVHRVVLPTAKPSIQYRVGDDFGIRRLQLEVQVERDVASTMTGKKTGTPTDPSESAADSVKVGEEKKPETSLVDMLAGKPSIGLERLPFAGKFPLKLSDLNLDASKGSLTKGDRLKVVLVAEDDRGDAPGETFRSEPIIIEISDEFGVASAVGEADPQAEQRVTEIIKRQLGIGESP